MSWLYNSSSPPTEVVCPVSSLIRGLALVCFLRPRVHPHPVFVLARQSTDFLKLHWFWMLLNRNGHELNFTSCGQRCSVLLNSDCWSIISTIATLDWLIHILVYVVFTGRLQCRSLLFSLSATRCTAFKSCEYLRSNVYLYSWLWPTDSLTFFCVNAGVSSTTLLHSKSLRGHRDCFEKCHLIANQKLSRSKVSRSAYEGMKLALSQKLNRIIQYAQNKDSVSSNSLSRRGTKLLCYNQQSDRKLLPQTDAQVPRYTPHWDRGKTAGLPDYAMGMLECHTAEELGLLQESQPNVWTGDGRTVLHGRSQSSGGGQTQHRLQGHSRDECERPQVTFFVFHPQL